MVFDLHMIKLPQSRLSQSPSVSGFSVSWVHLIEGTVDDHAHDYTCCTLGLG